MHPSGAQVTVAAFGQLKNEQRLNTFYDGWGGWRWGGLGTGMATTTTENTPAGTLNVDMFDTQLKKLIWAGRPPKLLRATRKEREKTAGRHQRPVQKVSTQIRRPGRVRS
jgi:hypothetical protein